MFRPGAGGSNLSHNHQLVPQSIVVDGRTIVNMESSLSPEEFNSIKEQSHCRVNIPQMRVNLESVLEENARANPDARIRPLTPVQVSRSNISFTILSHAAASN